MTPRAWTVSYAGLSEKGPVREENQDGFLAADLRSEGAGAKSGAWTLGEGRLLLAIADGMGGGPAGGEASQSALECLRAELARGGGRAEPLLRSAIEAANRRLFDQASSDPKLRGMGTTLTAALIERGHLVIGHVGDTRAYLARGGRFTALTTDHTLLGKVMGLTPEQARAHIFKNVLAQCVGGSDATVAVEVSRLRLRPGDVILLSTDGLHGAATDSAMAAVLSRDEDLSLACRRLVDLALCADTQDNVTAVLARFEGPSGSGDEERDFTLLEEVFFDRPQGRLAVRRPEAVRVEETPERSPQGHALEEPRSCLPATAGLVLAIYALVAAAALLRGLP